MKSTRVVLRNLSFSCHPFVPGGIGSIHVSVKHRRRSAAAAAYTSPDAARVFALPVPVFHLPRLRHLFVSNVLATLELGTPTIFNYVTATTVSFLEAVVEKSGGEGFSAVLELDLWTPDGDQDGDNDSTLCSPRGDIGQFGEEDYYGDEEDRSEDEDDDDEELILYSGRLQN